MQTATVVPRRDLRVVHCSLGGFTACQKNTASSILPPYKLPVSFLEKIQVLLKSRANKSTLKDEKRPAVL